MKQSNRDVNNDDIAVEQVSIRTVEIYELMLWSRYESCNCLELITTLSN